MPLRKREDLMATNKRVVWLNHESACNGYFNHAVDRLNGTKEEHIQWLHDNGVALRDYYAPGFMVFFSNDTDAMRFLLAWGQ